MPERSRSRSRARRGALVAALAGTVALVLAVLPGTGQAGNAGSNLLTVQLTGNGAGQVVQSSGPGNGSPAAISCSSTGNNVSTGVCVEAIPFGAPPAPWVGVTAVPPAGSDFTGWTVSGGVPVAAGYCGLTPTCIFQMTGPATVRANFAQAPGFPVSVLRRGPAGGTSTVTSSPTGIDCSPTVNDCVHSFPTGTNLVMTAAPGAGATFGGWTGQGVPGTCGTNLTCAIPLTQVVQAVATFNTATFALSVSVTGDGGVHSNVQPGIECRTGNSGTCSANLASGSQVILTAEPDTGYAFSGWSGGGCPTTARALAGATSTCTVTMSQAQSVTASFVSSSVQASVVGNRIRKVGPPNAVRQLQVTLNAEEDLARVVFRIRRGNATLQSRTFRNLDADQQVLRMNIRNGIGSGKAQLAVIMTNDAGTQKQQNRNLKIPGV
jgi:Divergent InlB B-repeat domain